MASKAEILRWITAGSIFVSGCAGEVRMRDEPIPDEPKTYFPQVTQSPLPTTQPAITPALGLSPTPLPSETPVQEFVDLLDEVNEQLIFQGGHHRYEGATAALIKQTERRFDVSIISPTSWIDGKEPKINLPWTSEQTRLIVETIVQLPPAYLQDNERAPREVILVKAPGSDFKSLKGGYCYGRITIETSEVFSPDNRLPPPLGAFIDNERDLLRLLFVHEWTHSFTEAHPEVLEEWEHKTGWVQFPDGEWGNERFWQVCPYFGASDNPAEDIATSAGLMLLKPEVLSQDRIDFFLTNEHFSNWQAVKTYQESQ